MLQNNDELERTQELLWRAHNTIASQTTYYKEQGYTPEQLERATCVMKIWEADLAHQVEAYRAGLRAPQKADDT